MVEKLKLYAYCRVSTRMQVEGGNLENQRRNITRFLDSHGDKYEIVQWFEDEGISAFKERPAYDRMLTNLIDGDGANGIVVVRLDRIGRSVKQLSNLIDLLEINNKKFIATEQSIDTSTMEGRLLTNILMAVAQFEVELFKERSREGRERFIDEGGKWGRNKIEISPNLKKQMIRRYNMGVGTTKLSKFLSSNGIEISPTTIWRRLMEWGVEIRPI
ncbi:MAG: recombinase family protein [Promethearchaeota archaeon]